MKDYAFGFAVILIVVAVFLPLAIDVYVAVVYSDDCKAVGYEYVDFALFDGGVRCVIKEPLSTLNDEGGGGVR
jgi:hypothetical protein